MCSCFLIVFCAKNAKIALSEVEEKIAKKIKLKGGAKKYKKAFLL